MRIAIYGNTYQERHIGELVHFFDALCRQNVVGRGRRIVLQIPVRGASLAPRGQRYNPRLRLQCGHSHQYRRRRHISAHGTVWVGDKQIPILGINTGHLGYLAATHMKDADEWIGRLLKEITT